MSRVSDPIVKMELEELESRLDKVEQSLKGTRESSSGKNAHLQKNTYRVTKEDGTYFVEYKHKDGWIRSSTSSFSLRG